MKLHQQIEAHDRLYTVVLDRRWRYRVLLHGRVEDAANGELVRQSLSVTVSGWSVTAPGTGLQVKTTREGFFAVAGEPERAFPNLADSPYEVDVEVASRGYRTANTTVTIPAGAGFPRPEVVFRLRPRPVRLRGRVTQVAGDHDPIAGAGISINTAQLAGVGVDAGLLRTPLHLAHDAGTPVQGCQIVEGAARELVEAAVAGSTVLTLSDRLGLAPGDLLRLGPASRYELVPIAELAPEPADPGLAGEVTLRDSLRRSFAAASAVRTVTPQPLPDSAQLAEAAQPGQGLLLLDGPVTSPCVRLASPQAEHHVLGAETDAEGYYRLDGLDRLTGATVVARAAGFQDEEHVWGVHYARPVNFLDFRLEP